MKEPSQAKLQIRLFGGFDVLVNGGPIGHLKSRKEQWLLALLVLRSSRETSREWLASTLWPGSEESQALFYLRKSLSNLRTALGSEASRLSSPTPRTLRFDLTDAFADVLAFDAAGPSAEALSEAAEIYKGPLLAGCDEEWAVIERGQRESSYSSILEQLGSLSEPAAAVRWFRLLIAHDPYRESAYSSLMSALADCGDRAAIAAVFRELQDRLYRDLSETPSSETEALYQELRRRDTPALAKVAAPAVTVDPRRHLPVPLTDLVGRVTEIEEVRGWVTGRRLVTLVGSGGVGKTRLAIAVAETALAEFGDGVWFVDLASLVDGALIAESVCNSLGIRVERGHSATDTINLSLAPRRILLVLDNCEQVVEGVAEFVSNLLARCANVVVLATSRQTLQVNGEHVYRVPSLPVPETSLERENPDIILQCEAVRLFVDRARRVDPTFNVTPRNAPDVAGICRQLDGIALAIEMAASRLRSMSVVEIRNRLSDRFRLLTGGNRGSLPRQQTLRAAIDWSYDQLSFAERLMLRRASVFSSSWTLEAAEAIWVSRRPVSPDVLDLLTNLVDKSLVIAESSGESTRFRLLETVRQYGAFLLTDAEEREGARKCHQGYYLSLTEKLAPNLRGPGQTEALSTLELELENVRAAIIYCIEDPAGWEAGLRFGRAMWIFWADRGYLREGRETLRKLLERPDALEPTAVRSDVLNGAGALAFLQSDYAAAFSLHQESLEVGRAVGHRLGIANALNGLGNVAVDRAEFDTARTAYNESLAIQRDLENTPGILAGLVNLGRIAYQQGDYVSAKALQDEALAICRSIGDRFGIARSLYHLAIVAFYEGDCALARSHVEESLAIRRELGHSQGIADSLGLLAAVAEEMGDRECAKVAHQEGLAAQRALGNKWGIGAALINLGSAVLRNGDVAAAKECFVESLGIFAEIRDPHAVAEALHGMASVGMSGAGAGYSTRLWGAASSLMEATATAVPGNRRAELECEISTAKLGLGVEAFDSAWSAGKAMSMDEAIQFALELTLSPP